MIGTISKPASGLPVLSSQMTRGITAMVNPKRKASIS